MKTILAISAVTLAPHEEDNNLVQQRWWLHLIIFFRGQKTVLQKDRWLLRQERHQGHVAWDPDYKPPYTNLWKLIFSAELAELFFAHSEADNNKSTVQKIPTFHKVLSLSPDSKRRSLRRTKTQGKPWRHSWPSPERLCCRAIVLMCLKVTTFIVVPKKNSSSCYNYCLVALTLIIMKCFEWLVIRHIKSSLFQKWTPTSLHNSTTARPMMLSSLPSTQPSPTWWPKTGTSECCLLTLAQHST